MIICDRCGEYLGASPYFTGELLSASLPFTGEFLAALSGDRDLTGESPGLRCGGLPWGPLTGPRIEPLVTDLLVGWGLMEGLVLDQPVSSVHPVVPDTTSSCVQPVSCDAPVVELRLPINELVPSDGRRNEPEYASVERSDEKP